MPKVRFQPLGPLLSGKGSRAFLALEVPEDNPRDARPAVMVWLPDELARDASAVAAVERDTNRAVVLEHPNIIRCFGLVREKEGVARVVEYADAESLRLLLEVSKRLPVQFAARAAADAALGAHYAHMAGNDDGTPMVHGDIRPETLLVSYGGICKVSGYGALAVAPKEVGGRRVRGRRQHCAPEQILGGRDAVNIQTDVYLLGVVLLESITGEVPFSDAPDFDQAVLTQPLPILSEELCPPALMRVIKKAMAKRSSERYPNALALREAIEQAIVLPDHESFALYLKRFLPEMEPARAARRRMLDEAIAKLGGTVPPPPPDDALMSGPRSIPTMQEPVSHVPAPPAPASLEERAAPPSAPSPPSDAVAATSSPNAAATRPTPNAPAAATSTSSAPRAPATAAPASSAPAVASPLSPTPGAPRSGSPPPKARAAPGKRSAAPYLLLMLLLVVLAGAAGVYSLRGRIPFGFATTLAEDAGSLASVGGTDGGIGSADGGTGSGAHLPDGGFPDAGVNPGLALTVDPAVDVTDVNQDNKPLGRTPFTVGLSAGRHVLHLVERNRGIDTSRAVDIPDAGIVTMNLYLKRGYVAVEAPDGSEIFIDGKSFGTAPQKDLGVYEGYHRIVVTVGKARWQEAFDIKPNERLRFDVDFQE